MRKKIWDTWLGVVNWCHSEFQRSANSLSKDLRSMRVLIIWVLIGLFIWVVIWSVLYFGNVSGVCNTAIVTCGGIVSWALSNYVISKQHEKVLVNNVKIAKIQAKVDPSEVGEGD